jgi:hypothetical protein
MTPGPRSAAHQSGPGIWWVLSGVLLVVAVACVTLGFHQRYHPLAPPVAAPTTRAPSPTTTVPVPVVAYSVPVSLRVPAITLSVSLSTLGLNPDGTVQVPDNDTQPGWFRLGPSPGQIGSAVILGHVDTYAGPGVFFQLRALVPGDQVRVSLTDGAVVTFDVTSVVQYAKAQFPAQEVYQSHGSSALQLVTCGGVFDQATGHYLSNVVVYTSFVSATVPTAPARAPAPPPEAAPLRI